MMTLKEWYKNNRDQESLIEMLDKLDVRLKERHQRGYCVMNFNPDNIMIAEADDGRGNETVSFSIITRLPSDLLKSKYGPDNISMLAALGVGLYMGVTDRMLNREVLRDQFSSYEFSLPEEKRDYYKHVLAYGKPEYQVDYFSNKNSGTDNSTSIARSKVKATPQGKAYIDMESAGRVNALGLSIFIVTILLLVVIGYILLLIN